MATTAPYGTWSSPITAEIISKATTIEEIVVDKVTSTVYHIEHRPSESGRSVLVETETGRDVVSEGYDVRNQVNEYGGSSAIVHDGIAYFSDYDDGVLYKAPVSGDEEPVSISGKAADKRFANIELYPLDPKYLVCMIESRWQGTIFFEVESYITTTGQSFTVFSDAELEARPKFSPDGTKMTWQEWYAPDMPWQGGQVVTVLSELQEYGSFRIMDKQTIAGANGTVSAGYSSWANNDTLVYITDESGYANPWKYKWGVKTPLLPSPVQEDFAKPQWSLGEFPYAVLDEAGSVGLFSSIKEGKDALYLLNIETPGTPQFIATPFVSINNIRSLSPSTGEFVFAAQKAGEPVSIFKSTADSLSIGDVTTIKPPSTLDIPPEFISAPQPMDLTASDGSSIHVIFYPPRNPNYTGSSISGEKPPCIVNVHGGPTKRETMALDWRKQFFTSRGWAWLDVNYRGSSGYGRAYVEKLNSNWGVLDVEDCIRAVKTLSGSMYGLFDPKRVVIRGEGSGGFTTLTAIATDPTVFAAAQSSFGPSDLVKLDETTSRFEAHYREKLLGGTAAEKSDVYKERSPINNVDKIKTPVLLLHGDQDSLVPKEHSELLCQAIKDNGGVAEYQVYEGETHVGWRKEATIRDALERELDFYNRTLKIEA